MKEVQQFSTKELSESVRFDAWRKFVRQTFGLDLRPAEPGLRDFGSAVSFRRCLPLNIGRAYCSSVQAHRSEREIADRYTESFFIYREIGRGTQATRRGAEMALGRGEWLVGNFDEPFETMPAADYNYEFVTFPRALILPHLPVLNRGRHFKLTGRVGPEALAMGFFANIKRNWENLDDHEIGEATDIFARLIGIACGARPEDHQDAVRAGRLARVKRFVEQNLANSALSPEIAAEAEGIRLRTLHACFEPTGESFCGFVRRLRVEHCRAALGAYPGRSVADIAFDCGFNSAAAFYRAFKAGLRMSPSDIRDLAGAGEAGPRSDRRSVAEIRAS